MLNPTIHQSKVEQCTTQDGNEFGFGEIVIFQIYEWDIYTEPKKSVPRDIRAAIFGKLDNVEAYVVNMGGHSDYRRYQAAKEKYGYPIRHLPLEWGKFTGQVGELIIPTSDLRKDTGII